MSDKHPYAVSSLHFLYVTGPSQQPSRICARRLISVSTSRNSPSGQWYYSESALHIFSICHITSISYISKAAMPVFNIVNLHLACLLPTLL